MTIITKGMGAIIKGAKKISKKASKAKGEKKLKTISKKDTDAFQKEFGKHKKALEAVNKPVVDEYKKAVAPIKEKIKKQGGFETKGDTAALISAWQKKENKISKVPMSQVYRSMPNIRQRFRGAPGSDRKAVKGVQSWRDRAKILHEKKFGTKPDPLKKYKKKYRPN